MYTDFYGFNEHPFNITPDPRFLYLTEAHSEALASLLYAIRERKGFVALTGEVGTGKTTLLHRLIDSLDVEVKVAYVFHTRLTFKQLLRRICEELTIPADGDDAVGIINRLNRYLIDRAVSGQTVALIIDEAQELSEEVLEDIRLLSNLETRSAKLLQIVLCGQPELEAKLNLNRLRQLRQRIGILPRIRPLTEHECWEYVGHRLRVAGGNAAELFTAEAMSLLCEHSGRIPRVINLICDDALLIGYASGRKTIGDAIMREAIGDVKGVPCQATQPTAEPAPALAASRVAPPARNHEKLDTLRRLLSAVAARRNAARCDTRGFTATCG